MPQPARSAALLTITADAEQCLRNAVTNGKINWPEEEATPARIAHIKPLLAGPRMCLIEFKANKDGLEVWRKTPFSFRPDRIIRGTLNNACLEVAWASRP